MSALRIPRRVAASDLPSAVPGVWHADSLGADQQRTQPSGYALLVQSPTRVSRQGQGAQGKAVAFPAMEVNILKRRGPPLVQDLHLPACHTRLALELAAQAARRQALHEAAHGMGLAVQPAQGLARHHAAASLPEETGAEGRGHALDRAAAAVLGG